VAPCADPVGPVRGLHRLLETGPINCALAQPYHGPLRGDQFVHGRAQGDGQGFGTAPLLALANLPRQQQRTTFLDHVEPAGHPAASHDPPIPHQAQGLPGPMGPPKFRIRHTRHRRGARGVLDPSGKACDTAVRLGAVGPRAGHGGPWGPLARHHATAQRRPRDQGLSDRARGLARILWSSGGSSGTIPAEVVAQGLLLLGWWLLPESLR